MSHTIIAVTGLNGSGKSTLAQYLTEEKGFIHVSFRSFLVKHLTMRNQAPSRENMRTLANELRKEHGAGYAIDELLKEARGIDDNVVIESIRTVNEARYLKEKDALIIATIAPIETRYKRITQRQSETDSVSYQEFIDGEQKESESNNPDMQNLPKVVAMADYQVVNDTLETFKKDIDILLYEIIKTS